MKNTLSKLFLVATIVLCINNSELFARSRTAEGAFLGAGSGALIGGVAGGGRGAGIGAAVGFGVGAIAGAAADNRAKRHDPYYLDQLYSRNQELYQENQVLKQRLGQTPDNSRYYNYGDSYRGLKREQRALRKENKRLSKDLRRQRR